MKETIIPVDVSAAKLRNFLVKQYGGEIFRVFYSFSNPYASWQALEVWIPAAADRSRLMSDLEAQGWIHKPELRGTHFSKGKCSAIKHIGGDIFEVMGPKKAKPLTIPYYD